MALPLSHTWPDGIDIATIVAFLAVVIVTPIIGNWLMILDIRAYIRALRGVLVRITYVFPALPAWARYQTPICLRAMGLEMPCSEEEVKRAYHQLAEQFHPDRGGDPRRFHRLQRHFENAINFVREQQAEENRFRGTI